MSAHSFSYSSRSGSASRSGWKKDEAVQPEASAGHLPAAYGTGEIGHLRHNVLGLRHGLDRAGRFTVAARHVHVQQGQRKPFTLAARPRQMGKEIAMPQEPGQRIGTVEHAVVLPFGGRVLHAQPLLLLEAASGRRRAQAATRDRQGAGSPPRIPIHGLPAGRSRLCRAAGGLVPEPPLTA